MPKPDYQYIRESGFVVECSSCGSQAPLISTGKKRRLCQICYETHVGNATQYPEQYDSKTAVIIAQVGNIILDAVTGRKP